MTLYNSTVFYADIEIGKVVRNHLGPIINEHAHDRVCDFAWTLYLGQFAGRLLMPVTTFLCEYDYS